jgi:osmotically-inducible protein OsmY
MQTDEQIQTDVLEELRIDPAVDATQIGVAARDGVVTLTGSVASFAEKIAAEEAAKRVYGVRGVAEEILVRPIGDGVRTDADIVKSAIDVLKWDSMVPDEKIKVTVEKGWLSLEGTVDWQYQREAAARALRNLAGVRGISNLISVKPTTRVSPSDVRREIFDSFRRSADLEARRIGVDVKDSKVVLHGNVHTWSEVEEARRAAWFVPGVAEVQNKLVVVP